VSPPLSVRVATVVLAVALVASVTEWALKLAARRSAAEPLVVLPAAELEPRARQVDVLPLARLLGAAGSSELAGMRALGIMADAATGRGIALIAVEGQPPRAYRTGDYVASGVQIKEVRKDRVLLSRAGVVQELRLPTKPAALPSPVTPAQSIR
jgi:general secretion pathway protein C